MSVGVTPSFVGTFTYYYKTVAAATISNPSEVATNWDPISSTASTCDGSPCKDQQSEYVYAGTVQVLPAQKTWEPIGPSDIPNYAGTTVTAGKMQAFAIDPANPKIMYVAGGYGPAGNAPSSQAGVYYSTDGGTTWSRQVGNGFIDPAVESLWIDQQNSGILLAGTWFGGIFRSVDGAKTWQPVYSESDAQGDCNSIYPGRIEYPNVTAFAQEENTIYAAASCGVLMSSDSGDSWTLSKTTSSPVLALASGGGAVYAGLGNGDVITLPTQDGIWTNIYTQTSSNFQVKSIAVSSSDPTVAYWVEWSGYYGIQGGSNELMVTKDSTNSNPHAITSEINNNVQVVALDPMDPTPIFIGLADGGLQRSIDQGGSWTTVTTFPVGYFDTRYISILSTPHWIVVGGDQGLFWSADVGNWENLRDLTNQGTWQTPNGQMTTSLVTSLAVIQNNNNNNIFAAVHDFSPIISDNDGTSWSQVGSGSNCGSSGHNCTTLEEDGEVAFNPGDSSYLYAFTSNGFWYSATGGNPFQRPVDSSGTSLTIPFNDVGTNNVIAFVPSTSDSVFNAMYVAGSDWVYQSTDAGKTFTPETSWPANPTLVAVSPDGKTIFVGNSGGLHILSDGSWTTATGLTGGYPTAIAFDPLDYSSSSTRLTVLVGLSQGPSPDDSSGGVWQSVDGGTSFDAHNNGLTVRPATFAADYAVPTPYVWAISFEPQSHTAAVATTSGLFISSNFGTWSDMTADSVPYMFTDVTWSGSYLYASTFGEGVLRTLAANAVPEFGNWPAALPFTFVVVLVAMILMIPSRKFRPLRRRV